MQTTNSDQQWVLLSLQRPRFLFFPLYALWFTAVLSAAIAFLALLSALVELPRSFSQILPLCTIITGGCALFSMQRAAQWRKELSYLIFEQKGQIISVSRNYLQALIEQELHFLYGKRVSELVCRILIAEDHRLVIDLALPKNYEESLLVEQREKGSCEQMFSEETSSGQLSLSTQQADKALPTPQKLKDQLTDCLHHWLGASLHLQIVLSIGFQEAAFSDLEEVHEKSSRPSHG